MSDLYNNLIRQRKEYLLMGQTPRALRVDTDSLEAFSKELAKKGIFLYPGQRILGLDIEISHTPNFEVVI
jgi:hypothetical protein